MNTSCNIPRRNIHHLKAPSRQRTRLYHLTTAQHHSCAGVGNRLRLQTGMYNSHDNPAGNQSQGPESIGFRNAPTDALRPPLPQSSSYDQLSASPARMPGKKAALPPINGYRNGSRRPSVSEEAPSGLPSDTHQALNYDAAALDLNSSLPGQIQQPSTGDPSHPPSATPGPYPGYSPSPNPSHAQNLRPAVNPDSRHASPARAMQTVPSLATTLSHMGKDQLPASGSATGPSATGADYRGLEQQRSGSVTPSVGSPGGARVPSSGPVPQGSGPVVLPDGSVSVRLHAITFNMANGVPDRVPPELFAVYRGQADVVVVGTQESGPLAEWERLVAEHLPPSQYVKVGADSLLSISLLVYARHSVAQHISGVRTSSVATGVGNMIGNKGGVALSMALGGARILLVTSHLAAHDEFVDRRNADYQRIVSGLFSSTATPPASQQLHSQGSTGSQHSPSGSPPPSQTPSYSLASGRTGSAPDLANQSPSGAGPGSGLNQPSRLATVTGPECHAAGGLEQSLYGTPTRASPSTALDQAPRLGSASVFADPLGLGSPSQSSLAMSRSGSTGAFAGAGSARGVLDAHDVVIWTGDLNYRINGNAASVKFLIESGMTEVLHANDQLRIQQKKGKAFQGFHEQPIHFPPTFKFVKGSEEYNMQRVPSWTDRVLHMSNSDPRFCSVRPLYYRSVVELLDSDHRPVVAGYEVLINPSFKGAGARAGASKGCVIS